jgi:hypothetical protein
LTENTLLKMNNLNNLTGIPMGGGQQQRPNFGLQFQNQLNGGNQNTVGIDFSWQAAAQHNRPNVVKTL